MTTHSRRARFTAACARLTAPFVRFTVACAPIVRQDAKAPRR
jgi:hypothetical protein